MAQLQTGIGSLAQPLVGDVHDFDAIVERAKHTDVALIGEATHGTHEFYKIRAEITKRLIREAGFDAVAIEGDWPDAHRVHRFVTGAPNADPDAEVALEGFSRFPTWMWRNADVLDFVGWLRAHDDEAQTKVGFYGLDLYALDASRSAVLAYLDRADPEAARRARDRYACFEHFEDMQGYAYQAGLGLSPSCEGEVVAELADLHRSVLQRGDVEAFFDVVQNARLVASAEEYYRTMYLGDVSSWNLRDRHMESVLEAIVEHRRARNLPGKVVVWAHNSHLGDARATDRTDKGEINLGQLAREHFGARALSIGFSTYEGTVTAASDWDEPAERKTVRPGLRGSYEALFHETRIPRFLLDLGALGEASGALAEPHLQRAIGVVYRPDTERHSHYFHVRLPKQFDFVLHYDKTRALEPLERTPLWTAGELPETYPTAL